MVVKILSSAGSFSGVEYNANKVSAGTAELMASENFGLLEVNGNVSGWAIHEYQRFFKAWSTNERGMIEKPQFHAVISCEGRTYSGPELKDIAKQYLEKMGYKNNPYLIYFHKDTANNHVHVVSSRVDETGRKVNDSFEHLRSQSVMKEILGQDIGQEVSDQVKKALSYNFSSETQFKMILEGKGVTVREKDGQYHFISGGAVAHEMARALVENKIKGYQQPVERIKQLKALFTKYKPALTPDKFAEFMKAKFGTEIIFHTAKGKETPYGYSIIDHAKGQVLKGSQVMALPDLLTLAPRADRLSAGEELLTTLAENEQLRYREFKNQLAKFGFELTTAGQVKISGEDKTSFTISKDRMKQVLYNDRLYEAQKFAISSMAEAGIIRRVLGLKKEDIALLNRQQPEQEQARIILSDKLNSLLSTGQDLGDIAKANNYAFAKAGNDVFLIDKPNHALYKMTDLTDKILDYSNAMVLDADRAGRPENIRQLEYASGTFAELAGMVASMLESNQDEQEQENIKRKRKRKD